MAVPGLAGAVPHLHEAHAALEQPAGDHHLPRLHAFAVHLLNVLGLLGEVEGIVGLHLHAVRQFEGLDARLEQRIVLPRAPGSRDSVPPADRAVALLLGGVA